MSKNKRNKKLVQKAAAKSGEVRRISESKDATIANLQSQVDSANAAMEAIVEACRKSRAKDAKVALDIACGFLQAGAPKVIPAESDRQSAVMAS